MAETTSKVTQKKQAAQWAKGMLKKHITLEVH